MELIGIPAYTNFKVFLACSGPISTSVCILCDPRIFLIKKLSRFRPQALVNFQLDIKFQGKAFLVPNDALSTRYRQKYLPHQ